jgi:hypothetical protein
MGFVGVHGVKIEVEIPSRPTQSSTRAGAKVPQAPNLQEGYFQPMLSVMVPNAAGAQRLEAGDWPKL